MSDGLQTADFLLDVSLPTASKAVEVTEDGDIRIEGLAADFGMDRENEAILPGAFQKAIDKFLAAGGPLVFQHRPQLGQLGQVTELNPTDDGLYMKAVIPRPADSSPLADVYAKVKRGMMRGLSAFGPCKRVMTRQGPRIAEIDLHEISVTAVPVNPRTLFAVATKALDGFDPDAAPLTHDQLSEWAARQFGATAARLDEAVSQAALQ